jgi:Ribbon-helix-helix domain
MPRKKKIKSVLYLYEEQMKALRKIAEKADVPVSKLIRDAVDLYLRSDK